MALNFDKFATEGNTFIKHLAEELNHPDETGRTGIVLRAVLHTLRDRITISESFDFMAQLPMFLKAVYVDEWKYKEKPDRLKDINEFAEKVKEHQAKYGESEFNWSLSTEEIIERTINFIRKKYVTEGEIDHIKDNLPEDLEKIFAHK